MIDDIIRLRQQALDELGKITRLDELEDWRIRYLGKKGAVTTLLRGLGAIDPTERPNVGRVANETKNVLESELAAREMALRTLEREQAIERERLDVTLPGRPISLGLGQVHPLTRTLQEIVDAFVIMGFQVVEGPEVEWDYYNFEALNIPKDQDRKSVV